MKISGKKITVPGLGMDGLHLADGCDHEFEDCIVDLSGQPLAALDEAIGVTLGSTATFRRCVIRGAGKLVLCGSGDQHSDDPELRQKAQAERGARVVFHECVLEDFGRRGPEVQDGMECIMMGCLIRNWGMPDRFDKRAFAAWAHHGGRLEVYDCVFDQPRFWRGLAIHVMDLGYHIGQAYNDRLPIEKGQRRWWHYLLAIPGIFSREAWVPGFCRGVTATAGGNALVLSCRALKWWIWLQGNLCPMPRSKALDLVRRLEAMRERLYCSLGRES